jgi:hypothetical protein
MDKSTLFLLLLLLRWFYVIFEEIIQINDKILFALGGVWQTTSLFFKRSRLMPHLPFIPTTHWMIFHPFAFVDV